MISLNFLNSFGRKPELFNPIKAGKVGIYSCGPTVYGRAHIGNFRAFITADLIRRLLEAVGYEVNQVMNITDVGHLVGDGSVGGDKVLLAAQASGKTAFDIAEHFTNIFFADSIALNILPAHHYPRATNHIKEQIEIIIALEKNNYTYKITDGIYFDTSKYPAYGELSGQDQSEKLSGARVETGDKKNPADFALWKFSPVSDQEATPTGTQAIALKREMEWDSPWGIGFPGWHIECSAMSAKYLGVPFDIHTGGADHVAVHHENELAQTAAATGLRLANLWIHNEFLLIDGGKMSKSLNNTYTLSDLAQHNISPLAFRYLLLNAHYRSQLNFTFESAQASQTTLTKVQTQVTTWKNEVGGPGNYQTHPLWLKFMSELANDLNTAAALAVFHQVPKSDLTTGAKLELWLAMDSILGLNLAALTSNNTNLANQVNSESGQITIPAQITALATARANARAAGDYLTADQHRATLTQAGYEVIDNPDGGYSLKLNPS